LVVEAVELVKEDRCAHVATEPRIAKLMTSSKIGLMFMGRDSRAGEVERKGRWLQETVVWLHFGALV